MREQVKVLENQTNVPCNLIADSSVGVNRTAVFVFYKRFSTDADFTPVYGFQLGDAPQKGAFSPNRTAR
jgi:hypothetical protein